MDMQEPMTSASERETLQEEIKRIQLALEGNYDDGSGDENGLDGSEDEDALNIDEDCEENPTEDHRLIQVGEEATDLDHGIEEFEDGEIVHLGNRGGSGSLLGENAGYVASLALNRAYQEVIKDCLKRIEDLLTSNSERQDELSHELEDRVLIRPNSVISRKNQLSNYSVPYFKDADGMYPPSNEDVRLKCARAEVRAHEMRPSIWKSSHKESLKKAVLNDAREKLLRPYMNRKEIEMEKLCAAQKATEECKFRLTLDMEDEEENDEDDEENEEDISDEDWEDEEEKHKKQKVPKDSSREKL
ncbi:leiomodin-3-like [Liolophura sinensis]|uniref:leiomodin-3-like n=1 Tax=Liolophura sinensis TaxID=3198878 RepID=UPI0031598209